jgi:hypothetical protein
MRKANRTKGRSRHRSVRHFGANDSRRQRGDLAHELLHGAYLLQHMFGAVLADSGPLREAHPELRVAIVKTQDALRDLYEAADAVLIEELESHPHFGCTALHWLGEETEADPEFGISLDAERVRARLKR